MMKFRHIIFLTLLFSTAGCKKFVEVGSPYTLTTSDVVFSDAASATGAQTAVYSQMSYLSVPFGIARRTGIYSDELISLATNDQSSVAFYYNSLIPTTYTKNWSDYYKLIYQANAVIDGLQRSSGIDETVKNQLIGEALFSRAYLYFYLVNLYGEIPLILTTNYSQNAQASRVDVQSIYNQIVTDCQSAIDKLNVTFVDGTSINPSTERTRPCKSAARALLARAYLYMGKYKEAADMATAVINDSQFSLVQITDVFKKNSKETIWSLEKPSTLSYTSEGYNFILQGYISIYGEGQSSAITPRLLSAFENNDQRRSSWIGSSTISGTTYYYPYKYKEAFTNTPTEYSVMLRIAEPYLIRAESNNALNNLNDAVSDLNKIRSRAGLGPYTGSLASTAIATAILHERQVEFFAEGGHRWFDLKRTGNADAVMTIVTPGKGGGSSWASYFKLWPVPQSEILLDHNLTQNPGYH